MLIKKVFSFSLPLVLANLVVALNGFAAMWVVAQLGDAGAAAGTLIYNTFTVMAAIVFAFSVPVSIFAARAYGAEQYRNLGPILRAGCFLVLGLCIPVIAILLQIDKIYAFFNQPIEAATVAAAYFKGYAFALIPFSLRLVLFQLLNGMSKTKLSLAFSVLELVIGAPLAFWFSQGGWGLTALGATGVALATACTSSLTLIGSFIYLHQNRCFKTASLFHGQSLLPTRWLKKMIGMGVPVSAQRVGEVTAFFAITVLIGHMGQTALASYEIPLQFSFISLMICFGFTQAAGILVGQALGEGQPEKAKQQSLAAIKAALIIALSFSAIFIFMPELLIHVFVNPANQHAAQITAMATTMLSITAVSQLFDVIRNVATGALRGYKDTRYPMCLTLLSCWLIGVPLGYALSTFTHLGATGATSGFATGVMLGCIFTLLRLLKQHRLTTQTNVLSTR